MTLTIPVPGSTDLVLAHLVLDVNGTLTDRGQPIDGVTEAAARLRPHLALHVLSADTFGGAPDVAGTLGASFQRVLRGEDKRDYVIALGAEQCAAIGNGRNDVLMLGAAALGIAVIGPEGASSHAAAAADLLTRSVIEALNLLADPRALTATLRP